MNTLRFAKMEGLGNDYIYLENFDNAITRPDRLAVAMSDRHFGAGGDGIILIGLSDKADFSMRMFNADGSEGEMCGNAIRCVGKYVFDHGATRKSTVTVETLAGVRTLDLALEDGKVTSARVDMGKPVLKPRLIPVHDDGKDFIDREVVVDGQAYRCTAVSMGNPHIVIPVPDVEALNLPLIGPKFENHPLFPNRINAEFIQVLGRRDVRMRVWERGAGETMACGTGACAVAVACVLNRWTDRTVTVHVSGGDLLVEWNENGVVYMTGPARHVFDGEYTLPDGLSGV